MSARVQQEHSWFAALAPDQRRRLSMGAVHLHLRFAVNQELDRDLNHSVKEI